MKRSDNAGRLYYIDRKASDKAVEAFYIYGKHIHPTQTKPAAADAELCDKNAEQAEDVAEQVDNNPKPSDDLERYFNEEAMSGENDGVLDGTDAYHVTMMRI